jgi:hypothetical protein
VRTDYRPNLPSEVWLRPGRGLPTIQLPTLGVCSSGDIALTERQMDQLGTESRCCWGLAAVGVMSDSTDLCIGCGSRRPDEVSRFLVDFRVLTLGILVAVLLGRE